MWTQFVPLERSDMQLVNGHTRKQNYTFRNRNRCVVSTLLDDTGTELGEVSGINCFWVVGRCRISLVDKGRPSRISGIIGSPSVSDPTAVAVNERGDPCCQCSAKPVYI